MCAPVTKMDISPDEFYLPVAAGFLLSICIYSKSLRLSAMLNLIFLCLNNSTVKPFTADVALEQTLM